MPSSVTSSPCAARARERPRVGKSGRAAPRARAVQKPCAVLGVGGGAVSWYTQLPVEHCSAMAAFMGCL